jgi:hypothetical protein
MARDAITSQVDLLGTDYPVATFPKIYFASGDCGQFTMSSQEYLRRISLNLFQNPGLRGCLRVIYTKIGCEAGVTF